MKFYGVFSEGSKVNQIICAVLINMTVFAYGASIGWMSPTTLLLQSEKTPTNAPLSNTVISWMAAVPFLVCIPFDFVMAAISDRLGRKFALIFISAANAASWMLLLFSTETWALILARALIGIPMAGCYVTCPIYTKEISDDDIRGTLGCWISLFATLGNLFLYVLGDILDYYTILWICLAIPLVHIVLFLGMPESPSYLVKRGKTEKAMKALAWLKCKNETDREIQREIDLITKEQEKDAEAHNFLLKTMLTDKVISKAFVIAMIVVLSREICGAITVLNFAGEIFSLSSQGTSIVISPNQQAMILGAVQVIGSILASSVVEKSGRKSLLFLSSLVCGISMCSLATWFLLREYQVPAPTWIPLLTLCLCIFCDASGLLPMSVVLSGEIFSFKYRSTVMATTMATASLSGFVQLLIFKPLVDGLGIHVAFYFFAVVCLFLAAYVILVIPETKARSLEDIYKDLSRGNAKKLKEKEAKNSSIQSIG